MRVFSFLSLVLVHAMDVCACLSAHSRGLLCWQLLLLSCSHGLSLLCWNNKYGLGSGTSGFRLCVVNSLTGKTTRPFTAGVVLVGLIVIMWGGDHLSSSLDGSYRPGQSTKYSQIKLF